MLFFRLRPGWRWRWRRCWPCRRRRLPSTTRCRRWPTQRPSTSGPTSASHSSSWLCWNTPLSTTPPGTMQCVYYYTSMCVHKFAKANQSTWGTEVLETINLRKSLRVKLRLSERVQSDPRWSSLMRMISCGEFNDGLETIFVSNDDRLCALNKDEKVVEKCNDNLES